MREQLNIPEDHLRACLQDQYDLSVATLEFLPLGLDTRAGVYRVVSAQGTPYFLKVKSGALYESSCHVPRYLRDQGILSVVAPLPTKNNALWAEMEAWMLILYPFVAGETGWNLAMTGAQWRVAGAALKQIHQVGLPAEGFASLRKESFDPAEYTRQLRALEPYLSGVQGGSQIEQEFRSGWMMYQDIIHIGTASLGRLADALRGRSGTYVICHADLHPSNMIRDHAGQVFIIDWDDVMLAPKERDFLFIDDAPANVAARQDTSPFFQGYGQAEIDWIALTYYLWERIITDLIYCAENVLVRDDLGEAAKAEEVRVFRDTVGAGGTVDKALAAAAHLPSSLTLRARWATLP